MRFKVICRATPGHVHCRVFCISNATRELHETATCGSLTVRQGSEFASLVKAFAGAEFVAEDAKHALPIAEIRGDQE